MWVFFFFSVIGYEWLDMINNGISCNCIYMNISYSLSCKFIPCLTCIWHGLIVCFCSIPLILMTQVHGCLRSSGFSTVQCAYTCMENQGADCESLPYCCRVEQWKLKEANKIDLVFLFRSLLSSCKCWHRDWLHQSMYVSKSPQRLNTNASWQATRKVFLSVGVPSEWEIRSSLVLDVFRN